MTNFARVFGSSALALSALFSFSPYAEQINAEQLKAEQKVQPFDAVYDMYRQGDNLGQGTRSLKSMGNNKYTLELNSKLEWMIFSHKRNESSLFEYVGNKITPISYNYSSKGFGKDKKLTVDFKPDGRLIVSPAAKKSPAPDTWQAGWLDEMSLHLQVQVDLMAGKKEFEYNIITSSGKFKTYKFEVIGNEIIATGMGRLNSIKVARVYDDKKFYAQHAWFVPELNYTLARLWRMKKGVEQYDLVIKEYVSH